MVTIWENITGADLINHKSQVLEDMELEEFASICAPSTGHGAFINVKILAMLLI